jgi:hypothetical protein
MVFDSLHGVGKIEKKKKILKCYIILKIRERLFIIFETSIFIKKN